jgi:2-oxoacid:acceptor oxidoreductase gamma subunit (pyruvate/2-ketoisovalerate family)
MTEIIIHGRGGQGGVTLAKLIAAVYFRAQRHVQAFGLYAAERSGAPVQAFVRIDDREITTHNQIRAPDHVVVLDPILASPAVASDQKPDGWIIINTRSSPDSYAAMFSGRNVAVIDATGLAVRHGLGTQAVPIVNTTMFGAVARVLDLSIEEVESALNDAHLTGGNRDAAQQAFEQVWMTALPGSRVAPMEIPSRCKPAGLLDEDIGDFLVSRQARGPLNARAESLEPPCNHICRPETTYKDSLPRSTVAKMTQLWKSCCVPRRLPESAGASARLPAWTPATAGCSMKPSMSENWSDSRRTMGGALRRPNRIELNPWPSSVRTGGIECGLHRPTGLSSDLHEANPELGAVANRDS